MAKSETGQLVKTQKSFTTQIKIGENTVNLPCILDFNEAKGTGVVNIKILTKHLSVDEKQQDVFFKALQKVAIEAYEGFLDKTIEYEKGQSGAGPNQQELPFGKAKTGPDEEDGALVNVGEDDYEDEED